MYTYIQTSFDRIYQIFNKYTQRGKALIYQLNAETSPIYCCVCVCVCNGPRLVWQTGSWEAREGESPDL